MSDFVVSARKYRPATFASVVGQGSITATLKNAIRSHHLAQAFLFCGSRGVGKTTCARILAKTVNCTNLTADTEACNACPSCLSFNRNQALNIIELDAASNNSVDDIRSLVEQVRYPPQSGSYKIYIIDEAHMLSQSAFNAFLKTLEEPPPYALFILATTEKHKIIPTIMSRCQIYDFNRIETDDIAGHLLWIAGQEKIEAEPEALHIIAVKAEGALRDALSIFDQIVSFAGNRITYKDVIANLNILDYDYYFRITDCILQGDIAGSLLAFNELLREGFDGHRFINGFGSHLRDVLVSKDKETLPLLQAARSIRERYGRQAAAIPQETLFGLLDIASQCDVGYRASQNQRLHVELALIRMCRLSSATESPQAPAQKKTAEPGAATQKKAAQPAQPAIPAPLPSDRPVTAKEKPVPRPAPVATAPAGAAFTPSIRVGKKAADKPDTGAKNQASDESYGHAAVSQEGLVQAWTDFLSSIDASRQSLITTMAKREPRLAEGLVIEFDVDNEIQATDLNAEKQELLDFLRRRLDNGRLQLLPVVLPPEKRKDDAYTPAEKFRKMADRNPALDKLRREFDLDF